MPFNMVATSHMWGLGTQNVANLNLDVLVSIKYTLDFQKKKKCKNIVFKIDMLK